MITDALAPFEPPNHVYSAFSFIAFLMCAVPFYWHLEAWNTGTCLYMFWTGLTALTLFINSVVWDGNAINWAPVWCDISTRIIIASNTAIVVASLCINRRLYMISCVKSVTNTPKEKKKMIYADLALGLGIPLLQQIMYIINEGHRFDIFEDFGCWPPIYVTPVAVATIYMWPIIIGCVSAVYCSMTLYQFWKRRKSFNDLLKGNSNLSFSRYWRLMALSAIEVICTIPLSCWALSIDFNDGLFPWISWEDTHSNFSRVVLYPSVLWRADPSNVLSLELYRWLVVLCAFVFFAFFGFADEALKHYRLVYTSVASRLGYSTGTMSSTGSSTGNHPNMSSRGGQNTSLDHRDPRRYIKRDSLLSLSESEKEASYGDVPDFGIDLNVDTSNVQSNWALDGDDIEKGKGGKPWSPIETTASSSVSHLEHEVGASEKHLPAPPELNLPDDEPESSLDVSTVTRSTLKPEQNVERPLSTATI